MLPSQGPGLPSDLTFLYGEALGEIGSHDQVLPAPCTQGDLPRKGLTSEKVADFQGNGSRQMAFQWQEALCPRPCSRKDEGGCLLVPSPDSLPGEDLHSLPFHIPPHPCSAPPFCCPARCGPR